VQDAGGTWLALDARFLKFQQRSAGHVYQAALRAELTARLGVGWESPAGVEIPEIAGIPARLRELFSARSDQVAGRFRDYVGSWVADHDGAEPSPAVLYRLERLAAEHSRPDKGPVPGAEELRGEWAGRARDAGFGPVSVPVCVPGASREASFDPDTVVEAALARVAERSSAWLRADLAREVAIALPAGAAGSGEQLVGVVDRLAEAAAACCVELHPGAGLGFDPGPEVHVVDRQLTSPAVLDQEDRLIAWARAATDPADLAPVDPSEGLDSAQVGAARAVAGRSQLVLVVGPAGTGKTTMLRQAVNSLATQGRAVLGLAPSGKAADVLGREAGCEAVTLAKLLDGTGAAPAAGATLILDEAGMAFAAALDHLVRLVRQHGWRLACVGDGFQLPAVGRGGMFAHWADTLPAVRLEQVHRFENVWEAEASLRLRAGEPAVAETYAAQDRLQATHPALAAEQVARRHQALTAKGQTVAVTTAGAALAREINQEIQHHQRNWQTGPSVRLHDGTHVFTGDVVATRHNDRSLVASAGATVRNRQTWTVTTVRADGGLLVSHPERGQVLLPAAYVSRHVELGWAVTGYGNQGVTVDHGICVIEPTTSRAGAYVGLTRGRKTNTAIVLDPTSIADPAETLAAVIRRPANGITAHAVSDSLRGEVVADPPDEATRTAARLRQIQQQTAQTRRAVRR
jgi:hypothetical protein